MLKALSDFFTNLGVHPLIGGFLLGVGPCLFLWICKKILSLGPQPSAVDDLTQFRNPNAISSPPATPQIAASEAVGQPSISIGQQQKLILPSAISAQVLQALRDGQKIEAIKIFREHTGLGLAESKAVIDQLDRVF